MAQYNISNISEGFLGMIDTVVMAVPPFFPIIIFVIWLIGSLIIYTNNIKSTNEKNIKNPLLAMAFVAFLSTLALTSLNRETIIYMPYYWIIFYILIIACIYYFIK